MRTCSNCGAQFPDDELICPVCGHEVQLVPDYVTIETHHKEEELKKEEEQKKRQEEQARLDAIAARKKQIHRNVILTILLAVAAVAAVIIFVMFVRINRNSNSFDYQYQEASSAYETGDYDRALAYIKRAISLDDKNADAHFLLSEIYAALKDTSSEEKELLKVISLDSDYDKAYDMLIELYEKEGKTDSIIDLLKNTDNKTILSRYAAYIAKKPVFDPDEGKYSEEISVKISSESEGTIYFTTDGSDPDQNSDKYTEPIALDEGTTTVKAVLITDKGIASDIASASYTLTFRTPPAPKISPASGSYEMVVDDSSESISVSSSSGDNEEGKITVVVPDGYTCYYSFDSKPTASSRKYTKPVSMKEGEHIFYAVLQDNKTGKLGKVASATYVFAETTPTPTPTPAPARKSASNVSATETRNAENVATPTPTPTPTETPAPTAVPEPTASPEPTAAPSSSDSAG